METGGGTVASIPLGDFLTTAEPVWVWDAGARKILWANQAGRSFWRADSVDALRARRFPPRSKWVALLAELATAPGEAREWLRQIDYGRALGHPAVRCQVQALQVAGGRPGLILRVLDYPPPPPPAADIPPPPQQRTAQPPALEAVAAKLKAAERQPARPPAVPPSAEALALQVRELCHEMRNPLSVIQGFAERIKTTASGGPKADQLGAYADDIVEGAELAMAILADFTSRILHPDTRQSDRGPAHVKAAVEACLRLIAPLAKSSGLKVHRRLAGGLPPLMIAERVLKQVLLNLLMNAIRHHRSGGQIRIVAGGRRGGMVRLAVIDDGKGMSKKDIRAALGAGRKPAAQQPGRSGLGLPLVKRLVEAEGGTIAITSERGKGTMVEIVFHGSF